MENPDEDKINHDLELLLKIDEVRNSEFEDSRSVTRRIPSDVLTKTRTFGAKVEKVHNLLLMWVVRRRYLKLKA
jgi:hypothetical protein